MEQQKKKRTGFSTAKPAQFVDEALFTTADCITRYPEPVLTYKDVPYRSALTFNAGVLKLNGKYIMIFRNDVGDFEKQQLDYETNLGLAFSDDGIKWNVRPQPCFEIDDEEIMRVYDPRITYIDGEYCVCFAVDTRHGVCGGMAVTKDLKNFEIKSISVPENRNMVLFPEKINGKYVRLERPMPVYSRDGTHFDMWLSDSPDLVYWGNSKLVLATEDVPFCNDKIGPGAPPVKTDKGWLTIFHSVDIDPSRGKNGWEAAWRKRYVIGIALLDLDDPSKVIGMSKRPLIVPEGYYETEFGYRANALFPCGMLLEDDGTVKIYYSAGDAVVRLATAKVDDLIALCNEPRK
ncbi:MAG: glycoside hydrolase family 130 protein [Clostridia bacterium]|nr:glycoside hydrolase family 130 protein [Clostridia bacterium]